MRYASGRAGPGRALLLASGVHAEAIEVMEMEME
jgi:hypothetical protein